MAFPIRKGKQSAPILKVALFPQLISFKLKMEHDPNGAPYSCNPLCDFTSLCPTETLLHKLSCTRLLLSLQMTHWSQFSDARSLVRHAYRTTPLCAIPPIPDSPGNAPSPPLVTESCPGCSFQSDSLPLQLEHQVNCESFFLERFLGVWSTMGERHFEEKAIQLEMRKNSEKEAQQTRPKELAIEADNSEAEMSSFQTAIDKEEAEDSWLDVESFVFVEVPDAGTIWYSCV